MVSYNMIMISMNNMYGNDVNNDIWITTLIDQYVITIIISYHYISYIISMIINSTIWLYIIIWSYHIWLLSFSYKFNVQTQAIDATEFFGKESFNHIFWWLPAPYTYVTTFFNMHTCIHHIVASIYICPHHSTCSWQRGKWINTEQTDISEHCGDASYPYASIVIHAYDDDDNDVN